MKAIKYLLSAVLLGSMSFAVTSCSDDDLGETIFPDVDSTPDPTAATYQLDKFLWDNFLTPYNLQFKYKMEDVNTDMDYNLVPATYDKSVDLAVLVKHLWFDVYDKVAGPDFLKQYGPRIIHVIGSRGYQTTTSTILWGLTESRTKISLFGINELDPSNTYLLNTHYFETMHHEFAHVLHQTKTYPTEFATVSVGNYDATNWSSRQESMCNSKGFITNYASSAYTEDMAEIVAQYITLSDAQWERKLELAGRGWTTGTDDDNVEASAVYYCYYYYDLNDTSSPDNLHYCDEYYVRTETDEDGTVHKYYLNNRDLEGNRIVVYDVEDEDKVDGVEVINRKLQIMRTWLADVWGVDLDALRTEVQARQAALDIESLRQQVYGITKP